jgi:hypothetical protein
MSGNSIGENGFVLCADTLVNPKLCLEQLKDVHTGAFIEDF